MGCEQWHEALSARLDGEETTAERAAVEAHLSSCADCRRWYDRAAAVNRRVRLSVAPTADDLAGRVLAALPTPARPRRGRQALGLRTLLGLVGTLQLGLGLAQVGRGPAAGHDHSAVLTTGHLWHESAAWNVAVGAGFLFVAARRTPSTGLVPTLNAFVGTLLLLSVDDLLAGLVQPARLVSHGFLLAGYAIVVALARSGRRPDDPTARHGGARAGWRLVTDESPDLAPAELRLVPPHPGSVRVSNRHAA
ncbi:zf-HC2 domain-containing protein [Micromonospora sp. MS34]|uniref:zf-HC2 domain-containing protein n=1 Tax=Micromonospora sp. MS34 TaxID=3385971 RepID=UPI0039A37ABB